MVSQSWAGSGHLQEPRQLCLLLRSGPHFLHHPGSASSHCLSTRQTRAGCCIAEQVSPIIPKLFFPSLKYFCKCISIYFSHLCTMLLSPKSPGIRWYILIFLFLRHVQLMSSIHGRSSSDGFPKADTFERRNLVSVLDSSTFSYSVLSDGRSASLQF